MRQYSRVKGNCGSGESEVFVRICSTVLTQPGTPVSFRGMCICLLFDFRKLRKFRCFPFPENSGTPTFPISGNSGLRRFLLLVIHSCISPFTCDSVVSPCFMLLFSLTLGTRAQIPTGYMVKTLRSQSTCDSNMPSGQMLNTF